jgi:hypothetical protein
MTNTIYQTPPPPVMPPDPEQAPKPPRRHRWVLPAAVVAALLLGGGIASAVIATGSGTARPQPSASQQLRPGNPVPILSRTGARVPSATVYGETDSNGYRYATGYFAVQGQRDAEQVTVYTFATKADMQSYLRQNPPSDRDIGIRGNGLYAAQVVGMVNSNNETVYSVTPTQIAHRVGGTLIGGPRWFKHVSASKPKPHIQPAHQPVAIPNVPIQPGAYGPYLDALAAAGIVAPDDWAVQAGNNLASAWANGATTAQTDQYLLAGGIYPSHLAAFNAIVREYLYHP